MFRLHLLSLRSHPTLGDIEIEFSPENKKEVEKNIYTSMLIGMNGTGKSYILKAIGDLFFEINRCKNSDSKERVSFAFYVRYSLEGEIFNVFSSQWLKHEKSEIKRHMSGIFAFKGMPPLNLRFEEGFFYLYNLKKAIQLQELKLPNKVIASSTQINDRFTFKKDNESSVYKYCGVKRTARNISTNAFKRNIADSLLITDTNRGIIEPLESALSKYLNFDPYLKLHYRTKYSSKFFDGQLTPEKLNDFYVDYAKKWNRKTEPWGAWKYHQLKREDEQLKDNEFKTDSIGRIEKLVDFINSLYYKDRLSYVYNTDSKRITLDIFEKEDMYWDSSLINDLQQLDLIYLEWIELKKKGVSIDLDKTSAGENQIIMSLLSVLSKIEENSLVLIDEPEISLHPNWQMAYIDLLKLMFGEFSNCHFILATHSHFMISDLKDDCSDVISLKRIENNEIEITKLDADTYGWSAEDILFRVFHVRTNRNFYIENVLRETLSMISEGKINSEKLNENYGILKSLNLNPEDPLNMVINKIEKVL